MEEVKINLGDHITCKTVKLKNGKFLQRKGKVVGINKDLKEIVIVHPNYTSRINLGIIEAINDAKVADKKIVL